MHLRITGDAALFAALDTGGAAKFFCVWDVNGALPLGARRHRDGLRTVLGRAHVDDVVLFRVDPRTGEPTADAIDPSLTCYEAELGEGAFVFLSCNPSAVVDAAGTGGLGVGVLASLAADAAGVAAPLPWVPFAAGGLRFAACGDAVAVCESNRRRVTRIGGSGWDRGVALGSACVAAEGACRWSVRITLDRAAAAAEREFLALDCGPDGDGPAVGDAGSDAGSGESDDEAARRRHATATSANANPSGFPSAACDPLPHVAVGVADEDVPLNGTRVLGAYAGAWLLDVVSGAFFSGTAARPVFVDPHHYLVFDGMVLTFLLDPDSGALNIMLNGRCVLATAVPAFAAHSLYPAVALYSHGASVELM